MLFGRLGAIIFLFFIIVSANALPTTQLTLYINTAEGGEVSQRSTENLKQYLNNNGCHIQTIETGTKPAKEIKSDLIFQPLASQNKHNYELLAAIKVINDGPLSTSILVRSSTGITDLRSLEGVRMAYLSEHSQTGFVMPQVMFQSIGIIHPKNRITFTQTNVGAISLLLHKDVFAAAVASPLAIKWAKANDLNIVAESAAVISGGIYRQSSLSETNIKKCQKAFIALSEKTKNNKKLLKIFPAWVAGFTQ
jgi:hypothetical protein